jgi:predicted RNase H-like HicB family nuclease
VEIKGIANLREHLKTAKNVFVKISTFRGVAETFPSKTYTQVKSQLDELEAKYGPMMEAMSFIVEKEIPNADEVGYDGYCIDGEFPNEAFYGFEIKNKAYLGKLVDYDDLPDEVIEANTRLSYHMEGYRQFWSTELRGKTVIDITARHASPAGETFCQAFENLPEILYFGAEGKLVHAKSSGKFVAQIILCSEWATHHPLAIEFPEEIRPFVKIYNHCRIDGVDYCIPDSTHAAEVASVVAVGDTIEEVCKQAKELAEKVSGFQLKAQCDYLDQAVKEMEDNL